MEKQGAEGPLKKRLLAYAESDYYGFHMPGHKRQMGELGNPYQIDITEIDGFDDLHHPQAQGILAQAQARAARLYGAEETHFLINGSTAGILSAISGCTSFGGRLLMARNSHRSAYHGAGLRNLKLSYLYPQTEETLWINGGISPKDVENSLKEHPELEAVFLTSPTYEGICTDVRTAAEICHRYNIPLIVDQAHGAHFPFCEWFPEDALRAGADVVIESVHKTLPALTQTALLHMQGNLVDRERVRYYLSVYQSSSPSYVLMASVDSCMEQLEREGCVLFGAYQKRLERFRESCKSLKWLRLAGQEIVGTASIYDFDLSRLVISTGNTSMTGMSLMRKLRCQYHLEMEMATEDYVIGISSVADREEDFERLSRALHELDEVEGERCADVSSRENRNIRQLQRGEAVLTLGEALECQKEWAELEEAEERISGAYLYVYPPGIPVVIPGEKLTGRLCRQIARWAAEGRELHGLDEKGRIPVIRCGHTKQ